MSVSSLSAPSPSLPIQYARRTQYQSPGMHLVAKLIEGTFLVGRIGPLLGHFALSSI